MKPPLKKLTLLLTLLPALTLTVAAVPKVVNGVVAPPESDQTYAAVSGTAALYVFNPNASYSGTNITLSSTINGGIGARGVFVTAQGSLSLSSGSVTTSGTDGWAVFVSNTASGTLSHLTITTSGYNATGVRSTQAGGALILNSVAIATTGINADAMNINSTMTGSNLTIVTHGAGAAGVRLSYGITAILRDSSVTTNGVGALGVFVSSANVAQTGTLLVYGGTIATTGAASHAVNATTGNWVEFHDATISASGQEAHALRMGSSDSTKNTVLTVSGGTVDAASGAALAVGVLAGSPSINSGGSYIVNISDEAVLRGAQSILVTSTNSGTAGVVDSPTDLTMKVSGNSQLHGDAIFLGSATAAINFDDSTLTGDLIASNTAALILTASNGATLNGNISGNNDSAVSLAISDHSTLTGNITTSEDNITTVNISDGGAIIGDLIGSGNSALTVTVGDGGALTGGLNSDHLTVTVNTGGNVTLNKDSAFGSLDNNGTLNIGDYQVSVSDLTNDGTIDIAVNTDSGTHGTLHVTGTSSGAGTIHVTSTGDGQANPNDVLGNLVTGNGTANYTWDEVDWGLEELIVTPNPDGTISIKEDGTSPAGAVLNSAIAVQQSLWFAQQNSLLKRMGDLRYGARASRPLADKDVRVPYNSLIDNIWIRSYGQQLNVGSQVAGKAYEQLIYGVDLGTDHKFTISADSDLYLGIYAGYGRSDIDYRTPGTDGEINSYYGGLYATWLHSSGFYIDATFKAASVDNDLKAPYGNTQLTANYSDVNIGGSLELGHKFTFTDDWFIEPQFQVNYLHILAEDYSAGPLTISAQDLDALQLRIGSLFGRTIKLINSGALQPYIKISGVETISSGGTLRNGYQHTRANTDGARAELGAGLIWQLDTNNQLHLDYEASFGDKYDKPWGLTAGYRHQF